MSGAWTASVERLLTLECRVLSRHPCSVLCVLFRCVQVVIRRVGREGSGRRWRACARTRHGCTTRRDHWTVAVVSVKRQLRCSPGSNGA